MESDQIPNEVEAATQVEAVEPASPEPAITAEASADPAVVAEDSAVAIEAAPAEASAEEPQQPPATE
jgi:hypothetical protein